MKETHLTATATLGGRQADAFHHVDEEEENKI